MNQEKFEKLYSPKRNRIEKLIPYLQEKPRPIYAMSRFLEVDKVTIRNYINTLRELNVDLKQDELKKYYI